MEWPEVIVEGILSRVGVRDLCRYKLVSKGLNQLISSERFKKNHLVKTMKLNRTDYILECSGVFTPHVYTVNGEGNDLKTVRIHLSGAKSTHVIASCNGLVCVSNLDDEYRLWNPLLRKTHKIPNKPVFLPNGVESAHAIFGLGYKASTEDYLLFRLRIHIPFDGPSEVVVYSKKEDTWRRAPAFPYRIECFQPGVFVCGRLHWMVEHADGSWFICALDVEDMSYHTIEVNALTRPYFRPHRVDRLDDETLVFHSVYGMCGQTHTLWLLRDYNDHQSWQKFSIRLTGPENLMYQNKLVTLQPMGFLPGRDRFTFRLDPHGLYIVYDIRREEYTVKKHERYQRTGTYTMTKFLDSFEHPSHRFAEKVGKNVDFVSNGRSTISFEA